VGITEVVNRQDMAPDHNSLFKQQTGERQQTKHAVESRVLSLVIAA
jgi:hypothetical protein